MSEMIDLSNNIQANQWIHSADFGLGSETIRFNSQQVSDSCQTFSHTSFVKMTHQERLSTINAWVKTPEANSHSIMSDQLFPNTVKQVVVENAYWKVMVPTTMETQYETLIFPKKPCKHLSDLSYAQRTSLAALLNRLAVRYDNLLMTSLDCEISWYKASDSDVSLFARYKPTNSLMVDTLNNFEEHKRSATAQKFANQLNSLSDIHFEDVYSAVS